MNVHRVPVSQAWVRKLVTGPQSFFRTFEHVHACPVVASVERHLRHCTDDDVALPGGVFTGTTRDIRGTY